MSQGCTAGVSSRASGAGGSDTPFSLLQPGPMEWSRYAHHEEPAYFRDLNLDQMVAAIANGDDGGRLAKVFYAAMDSADLVRYRQEIFRDLEDPELLAAMRRFKEGMGHVRRHLVGLQTRHDPLEWQGWFLDAVLTYCEAVAGLGDHLGSASPRSAGLQSLTSVIVGYRNSEAFALLLGDATRTRDALDGVRYCTRVRGGTVEVSRYQGQGDYSEEIEDTFKRFRQGRVKDYRIGYRSPPALGHVGSSILERVARLFPAEFDQLDAFCRRHSRFQSDQVVQLDFELGFYLAYLDYTLPIRSSGLDFCYPQVAEGSTGYVAEDSYDVVLAHKLVGEGRPVVSNSSRLGDGERIFVVSGPNQGGKTTFARTFGQLHHLAAIGCPVPGSSGACGMFDEIFTHFEREEQLGDLRGKLEDDLVRIHAILTRATERSIIVSNEIFTSTTLDDARFLGRRILEKMVDRGVRAVVVTFVDELAATGPPVVSLVSTVVPEDPSQRTFRVIRSPADGLAYAMALAEKYGVTYERLRKALVR